MKLFLDSAKINEIQHALDLWDVDGLTTNPKHVQASGKPFRQTIEEIAELFDGTDKPVSVEVNPHLTEWQDMVVSGKELAAISPNFVIKIGASENGFQAIRALTRDGIRCNATLVFSVTQAWHAARAGADYVSLFVGWKEQYGDFAGDLVGEVRAMLDEHAYDSQIIAAAIRNSRQFGEAAVAGSHCVTAGLAVYLDSFDNPYTAHGESVFKDAWDKTPQ
jgi:transaldolase